MRFRSVITYPLLLFFAACAAPEKTDVAEVPDSSKEDKQLESLISVNDVVPVVSQIYIEYESENISADNQRPTFYIVKLMPYLDENNLPRPRYNHSLEVSEQEKANTAYYRGLDYISLSQSESWEHLCIAANSGHGRAQEELAFWHRTDIHLPNEPPQFRAELRRDNRIAYMLVSTSRT